MSDLDNIKEFVAKGFSNAKIGNYDAALEDLLLAKYINKYESTIYKGLTKIFILKNEIPEALNNILAYFYLNRNEYLASKNNEFKNGNLKKSDYEKFFWTGEIYSGLKIELGDTPDYEKLLLPFNDIITNPEIAYLAGLSYLIMNPGILDYHRINRSVLENIKSKLKENIDSDLPLNFVIDGLIYMLGFLFIIVNLSLVFKSKELTVEYFSQKNAQLSYNLIASVLFFGRSPFFIENTIQYGFDQYKKGNIKTAESVASNVLLIKEDHARAMFLKGKCLYNLGGIPELHRINNSGGDELERMLALNNQLMFIESNKTLLQTGIKYLQTAAIFDKSILEKADLIISDIEKWI